jgi:mRNA interferase YafQ
MDHLKDTMAKLGKGEKLPRKYGVHPLKGEYKGHWECHLGPDALLIWFETETELRFTRVGTHQDLFGE